MTFDKSNFKNYLDKLYHYIDNSVVMLMDDHVYHHKDDLASLISYGSKHFIGRDIANGLKQIDYIVRSYSVGRDVSSYEYNATMDEIVSDVKMTIDDMYRKSVKD